MKNYAIILASGAGERSGLEIPKQFVKIAGKTVIEHTLNVFQNNENIDKIIVVTNQDYIGFVYELAAKNKFDKICQIVPGGETRQQSSYVGLCSISDDLHNNAEESAKVLIHDAVRPFVSDRIINDCINALDNYKAVDVAITSADTIIKVNSENIIENIPQRKYLKRGQTPQAFDFQTIMKAHKLALNSTNVEVTDDCGLITKFNPTDIYVVEGDDSNVKITYPIDIAIADKLFQLRTYCGAKQNLNDLKDKTLVVFGGNSGIGEAVCQAAKIHGAKVYPCSRQNGVDVKNIKTVKNYLNKVYQINGQINYVIDTAGILTYGEIENRDQESIEDEIKTNYLGCINVAKASLEYLKETRGGLLFYSSSSYTRGRKNYAVYSSSKAAIVNFTQALAEEWEDYGIRVNVIVPERTATPMRYNNFGEEPKETLLSPEYVAEISLNTLLDNISGQIINVSRES